MIVLLSIVDLFNTFESKYTSMKIEIRNQAGLPNKYERFIRWKLWNMKRKFDHLLYAEIFLSTEGSSPKYFNATIRLGIPGSDIILKHKGEELGQLWKSSFTAVHRYLRKHKEKALDARVRKSRNLNSLPLL
jgi:ribosome-associated translation inhibitor RaiA